MIPFDNSFEENIFHYSSLNPDSDNFYPLLPQYNPNNEKSFSDMDSTIPFLGIKRKSEFGVDSILHEKDSSINDSSKSEKEKSLINFKLLNNFDDSSLKRKSYLDNLDFTQDKKEKSLKPMSEDLKTKIFHFLIDSFFEKVENEIKKIDDRIKEFKREEVFNKRKWKNILNGNGVIISENDVKKEENKEAIELLEKTPLEYIKSVFKKCMGDSNNIKIDNRIAERLFNVIYCLLIQRKNSKGKINVKKEEKEEKKEEKEEKKEEKMEKKEEEEEKKDEINIYNNNKINENLMYYPQEDRSSLELINDFLKPNEIKENITKTNLDQLIQNNMSTTDISKNKNIIEFEITKLNRKDNLFNRLRSMIILSFEKDFNNVNITYKFQIKQKSTELEEEKIVKKEEKNQVKKGKKEEKNQVKKTKKEEKNQEKKKPEEDKLKHKNKRIKKGEKKDKKKTSKIINIQTDKEFIQSNFVNIVEELKYKLLKSNKVKSIEELKETKEATELMEKKKENYLKNIMNDKEIMEKFFQDDANEQEENYKKAKCKKMAIEIFNSENLDGLILLTKIMNYDQDNYIKIPNAEKFKTTINQLNDYKNFSLELNNKEKEEIENRKKVLIGIAKDPMSYLNKKKPKGSKENKGKKE